MASRVEFAPDQFGPDEFAIETFARTQLEQLDNQSLRRTLIPTTRLPDQWIERGGRRLLSFSCNDYLNLSHHPRVIAAAQEAAAYYGAGAGASRLITGNHPLLEELEGRLAQLKGTQSACVFGSGYLANSGIISTMMGRGDLILVDEWVHSCIWSGARLSGARILAFSHNDMDHLAKLLEARRGSYGRCLIAVDGVYSMDGDLAPLPALAALAAQHRAWVLCDDAHGVGVIGAGRGSSFAFEKPVDIALQMGTLSKSLGSYGGYVCATKSVIDLLKTRAASFVYSTALPPASAAAAIAALDVMAAEPERMPRLLEKARRLTRALNLPDAQSAIVPIVIGDAARAVAMSKALEADGFLVAAIRPPTVPAGTARLRVTLSCDHRDEDIDRLASCITALKSRPA